MLTARDFGKLLDAICCPICGGRLHIDETDGKRRLLCNQHGEMKSYVASVPRDLEVKS